MSTTASVRQTPDRSVQARSAAEFYSTTAANDRNGMASRDDGRAGAGALHRSGTRRSNGGDTALIRVPRTYPSRTIETPGVEQELWRPAQRGVAALGQSVDAGQPLSNDTITSLAAMCLRSGSGNVDRGT